jgi:hypothetical protein
MSFDWRRAARRARAVAPFAWIVSGLCLASVGGRLVAQQRPQIGIAPVSLTAAPYTFDTAGQHKIRVVIVASLGEDNGVLLRIEPVSSMAWMVLRPGEGEP